MCMFVNVHMWVWTQGVGGELACHLTTILSSHGQASGVLAAFVCMCCMSCVSWRGGLPFL